MSLDYLSPKSMPVELKRFGFWMAWRYEGKSKVPVDPVTLRKANWKNIETWRSFDEALQIAWDNGLDGIGIVLSEHDPFCAFDLDKCINPTTGEIDPIAAKIVKQLDSYTEYSPSWIGLRVIARGKKPDGFKQKNAAMPWADELAVYDRNQFITITGNAFGESSINERQEEIAAVCGEYLPHERCKDGTHSGSRNTAGVSHLSDSEALQKARNAPKIGGKFRELYDGGSTGGYYPSRSEGIMFVCGRLAYYIGNEPARIYDLLRESPLCRDRWEEVKDNLWNYTIPTAIANTPEIYQDGEILKQRVRDFADSLLVQDQDWSYRGGDTDRVVYADIVNHAGDWGWCKREGIEFNVRQLDIAHRIGESRELVGKSIRRMVKRDKFERLSVGNESTGNSYYRIPFRSPMLVRKVNASRSPMYSHRGDEAQGFVVDTEPRPREAEEVKEEDRDSKTKHSSEHPTTKTKPGKQTESLTSPHIEAKWEASEDHPLTCGCVTCSTPTPRHAKSYRDAGAGKLEDTA